jgi:alpha-glucosidase
MAFAMLTEAPPQKLATAGAEWWRGAAIYQVYVRSFADSNDDGIGDLPGVTSRLDYIASLGVDALWLCPFFTSPMCDFGYDVSDYCDVDPVFGTLADFDALLAKAHSLGLKVIIDQVYSHTSDQHPWFRESRSSRNNAKADWYVWADPSADGTPPNNWLSVFSGSAWEWDSRRGQYYLHNFLSSQPDLNLHNEAVQNAILDVARFWLKRGVDGFRLDAINFAMHDPSLRDNPPSPPSTNCDRPFDFQQHLYNQSQPEIADFLERLRQVTDDFGGRFTVAEVGGREPLPEMKAFTCGDVRLNSAYGFDFLNADRLTPSLVARAVDQWRDSGDEGWPSWAFENHDAPRALSRWCEAQDREQFARLKMLLLCSLRGSIILYQGEELGLPQVEIPFNDLRDPEAIANWPQTFGRDGARTPMPWDSLQSNLGFSQARPWLPAGESHRPLAVDRQEREQDSLLHFARGCLRVRNQHSALRLGSMTIIEAGDQLLVFDRESRGVRLRCAFNLSDQPVRYSSSGRSILAIGNLSRSNLGPFAATIEKID